MSPPTGPSRQPWPAPGQSRGAGFRQQLARVDRDASTGRGREPRGDVGGAAGARGLRQRGVATRFPDARPSGPLPGDRPLHQNRGKCADPAIETRVSGPRPWVERPILMQVAITVPPDASHRLGVGCLGCQPLADSSREGRRRLLVHLWPGLVARVPRHLRRRALVTADQVLVEVRDTRADDGGEHERGPDLGTQGSCQAGAEPTEGTSLLVGQVGQVGAMLIALDDQVAERCRPVRPRAARARPRTRRGGRSARWRAAPRRGAWRRSGSRRAFAWLPRRQTHRPPPGARAEACWVMRVRSRRLCAPVGPWRRREEGGWGSRR